MEAVVACAKSSAPHKLFHRAWRNPPSPCCLLGGVFVPSSCHSAAHNDGDVCVQDPVPTSPQTSAVWTGRAGGFWGGQEA